MNTDEQAYVRKLEAAVVACYSAGCYLDDTETSEAVLRTLFAIGRLTVPKERFVELLVKAMGIDRLEDIRTLLDDSDPVGE